MDVSAAAGANSAPVSNAPAKPADSAPAPATTATTDIKAMRSQMVRVGQVSAAGAFQQQVESDLRARFDASFAAPATPYAAPAPAQDADGVAAAALEQAKQLADAEPAQAVKTLVKFRAVVQQSATLVREALGERDDIDDVDEAEDKIGQGLDRLDAEAARQREATTSVLAMDRRSRESSTIRIRTQEGDIVSFDLRRAERFTAADAAYTDGSVSASSTSIEAMSRSRVSFRVEGDLNDSELAAIQGVFEQARDIAGQFYGGDVGAAFNSAQGFEFDSSQLSGVKLRFRSREVSNMSYLQSGPGPAAEPKPAEPARLVEERATMARVSLAQVAVTGTPVAPAESGPAASPTAPAAPQAGTPAEAPAAVTPGPATTVETVQPPEADVPVAPQDESANEAPPAVSRDAFDGFFRLVASFMQQVSASFEQGDDDESFSFSFSALFKLDMLKSVIEAEAPEGAEQAAANAELAIDAVAAAVGAELSDDINDDGDDAPDADDAGDDDSDDD